MPPWAGYTRVSRVGDRAETLISPELQAERIEAYAQARGLQVELLPPELDVSGGKVERPILGEALDGIERGEYRGLIVAQLDRLSRMDLPDAVATVKRIEAVGGQVISVAENFDAATPEGRMGRNVMFAVADMQLGRYKAQFRAAKQRAVERGIWPVRNVPFGYRKGADRKLEPHPTDAPKLRRVFEARANGQPWSAIQKITGLSQSAGNRIVQNRVYLGEVRIGEWVNPDAHPPLVDRALWEAAQLDHPRPATRGNPPALLAGIVRCAGCGTTMSPSSRDTERDYRCRPAKAAFRCPEPALISRRLLDEHVEGIVLAHLRNATATGAPIQDTGDADRELAEAEAELREYQRAVNVSGVGAEHFAEGMRGRVERVELARRQLAKARVAQPAPAFEQIETLWPTLTVEERRQVLRGALGVVWVRRGRRNVADRVRLVASGYEPPGLSRPGFRRAELRPLSWEADLPGEIGVAGV